MSSYFHVIEWLGGIALRARQEAKGKRQKLTKTVFQLVSMSNTLIPSAIVYETLKISSNTDTSLLISYFLCFLPIITPFSEASLLVDIAL
ncbi:MAG: hypothetical protein F6J90_15605 [Moorea sp. SIOASIH]|nr:hypothetical protein [Moorena sp. SIOASIH]